MTAARAGALPRPARYHRSGDDGMAGQFLGALFLALVRILWTRPLMTAAAAGVALFIFVAPSWGMAALMVVVAGSFALRHCYPVIWAWLTRPCRWEQRRVAKARARREGRRLAPALGLVDRSGRPYNCSLWRGGTSGTELVALDVVCPWSDRDIEHHLGAWAAVLQLGPAQSLALRRGRHAGHRVIQAIDPPPPLPERVEIPALGDLTTGLVLGVAEDGQLWRWHPHEVAHVLVTGATGAGKTAFARRVVTCWLAAGGEVRLLDYGKGTAFLGFDEQPAVRRAVSKPDCEIALAEARREMMRRYEVRQVDREAQFVPLLVAAEEPYAMMDPRSGRDEHAREDQQLSAQLADHLVQLAMLGREAAVHLLLSPQRGDAAALGSGAARDQLGLRVLMLRGAMDTTVDMAIEMSRSTLIPGREPPTAIRDLPSPPGRALVRGPDGYRLVQVAQ